MSLQEIQDALNKIEIPKQYQNPLAEVEFEDLRDDAQDLVKDAYDEIWTLLYDDRDKFQRFILAYEKDKLAILKNYLQIFNKNKI